LPPLFPFLSISAIFAINFEPEMQQQRRALSRSVIHIKLSLYITQGSLTINPIISGAYSLLLLFEAVSLSFPPFDACLTDFFYHSSTTFLSAFTSVQSDQVGRIFASWAIVYFEKFLKIT
jgi:hypothetical protein